MAAANPPTHLNPSYLLLNPVNPISRIGPGLLAPRRWRQPVAAAQHLALLAAPGGAPLTCNAAAAAAAQRSTRSCSAAKCGTGAGQRRGARWGSFCGAQLLLCESHPLGRTLNLDPLALPPHTGCCRGGCCTHLQGSHGGNGDTPHVHARAQLCRRRARQGGRREHVSLRARVLSAGCTLQVWIKMTAYNPGTREGEGGAGTAPCFCMYAAYA